uniref:SH2 domain-containing protein n=1 Tax=Macrostomum lignano TaxID=282301 RepID=A0A1I8ID03_9PLAT
IRHTDLALQLPFPRKFLLPVPLPERNIFLSQRFQLGLLLLRLFVGQQRLNASNIGSGNAHRSLGGGAGLGPPLQSHSQQPEFEYSASSSRYAPQHQQHQQHQQQSYFAKSYQQPQQNYGGVSAPFEDAFQSLGGRFRHQSESRETGGQHFSLQHQQHQQPNWERQRHTFARQSSEQQYRDGGGPSLERVRQKIKMTGASHRASSVSHFRTSETPLVHRTAGEATTHSRHQQERRTLQQRTVTHTPGEVYQEVETITLQPIGKGIHDLEAPKEATPAGGRRLMAQSTPHLPTATVVGGGLQTAKQQQAMNISQRRIATLRSSTPQPQSAGGVAMATTAQVHLQPQQYQQHSLTRGQQIHQMSVKDSMKLWYRPRISREEAINLLRHAQPGTFVVRDSNSFPGAFGLAVRVAQIPKGIQPKSNDIGAELVRHFLIEPTSGGVRLKGCANEPIFPTLAALVQQHSVTQLALPCRLIVPRPEAAVYDQPDRVAAQAQATGGAGGCVEQTAAGAPVEVRHPLQSSAACNVLYVGSVDVESLSGGDAVARAVDVALSSQAQLRTAECQLKVGQDGVTLTDNHRKLFFRRNYPLASVLYCGLDNQDRRFAHPELSVRGLKSPRLFGFVARKGGAVGGVGGHFGPSENTCVLACEFDPQQPAPAIVSFINKLLPFDMAVSRAQQQQTTQQFPSVQYAAAATEPETAGKDETAFTEPQQQRRASKGASHMPQFRRHALKTINYCLLFCLVGMSDASIGAALPGLTCLARTSEQRATLILFFHEIAVLLMTVFSGFLNRKVPANLVMTAVSVLVPTCFVLVTFCTSLPSMAFIFSLMGLAEGCLEFFCNTQMIFLYRGSSGPFLQAMFFSQSVGALVSPLIIGSFMSKPLFRQWSNCSLPEELESAISAESLSDIVQRDPALGEMLSRVRYPFYVIAVL